MEILKCKVGAVGGASSLTLQLCTSPAEQMLGKHSKQAVMEDMGTNKPESLVLQRLPARFPAKVETRRVYSGGYHLHKASKSLSVIGWSSFKRNLPREHF